MKSVRFILLFLVCVLSSTFGFCSEEGKGGSGDFTQQMATLGGIRDAPNQNSVEIDELARFAVDEHNKKQNALLEFVRVVKAKEQVVAGTMHYLTVEAIEAGEKKLYDAKVWVKPWLNFKQLEEFKPAGNSSGASAQ